MPIPPSTAQARYVRRCDQTAIHAVVDRLRTHLPARAPWVASPQPPADLAGRPPLSQLAGHDLPQCRVLLPPAKLRPPPTQIRLVMRKPGLVTAIRLAVAGDLAIHG